MRCFTDSEILSLDAENRQQALNSILLPAIIYVLAWSYAAVAIMSVMAAPVGKFDDSIPLVHGWLVQQGKTPNVDFYSFYPPLVLYLNGLMFNAFGRTIIASRLISVLLYVLVLSLVHLFFRSHFRKSGLLAATAVLAFATSVGGALKMPPWPGFSLSVAALLMYLCSQYLKRGRLWIVAGSGILTGLAVICRINFGAYAAFAILTDLVLQGLLRSNSVQERFVRDLRAIAVYAVPVLMVSGVLCCVIFGSHIGTALSQFVVTAQHMMSVRFISLSVSADVACAVTLPAAWFYFKAAQGRDEPRTQGYIGLVLSLVVLVVAVVARTHPGVVVVVSGLVIAIVLGLYFFVEELDRSELTILLFVCCLMHYYLSRADWDHWRLLPIGYALLFPFLGDACHYRRKSDSSIVPVRGTAIAVMATLSFLFVTRIDLRPELTGVRQGLSLLTEFATLPHRSDSELVRISEEPPKQWASVYTDKDEWRAVRYLTSRTSTSDPIFVGLGDHSTAFWSDLRFYWLAGRPIGVRTFQLETKIVTELPVQQEIIADLVRNRVSWIVLDYKRDGDEAFHAISYKGATALDDYIRNNFTEEARFGVYAILHRSK